MTINVVQSCQTWLPQTQTWLYNQVRYLPAARIKNHVVCERAENLSHFAVPSLYVLGGRKSRLLWMERLPKIVRLWNQSRFLVNTARSVDATLVHSHFGPIGWSNLASVRRIPARHIVTFYGYDMSWLPATQPIWKHRYQELFRTVERVLCEGPFMAGALMRLGCPEEKICVHHLGVGSERISFVPRRWVPGAPLRVLIAGTFTEKKGIPDALEALGRIVGETEIQITIIGDARPQDPGDLRELKRIRAATEASGLGTVVRFLGYQTHARLFEEAYAHHIFLSPSVTGTDGDTEGGVPVTIIEMAATGMPVVSTYHCDIPNVIEHGRSGLLAREHDVRQLAEHIRWLIQRPDVWHEMAAAARHRIDREFNARIQGLRLAAIYEDTISSGLPNPV